MMVNVKGIVYRQCP